MLKKSYLLFFFLIICLFNSSFSDITKKVLLIEGEDLNNAIDNSTKNKFKLFLIFVVRRCKYCTHALKILKEELYKHYENDESVMFGVVDLDLQSNVWAGLRFNITKIPHFLLIENNKMYQYENEFEEEKVINFIGEERSIEDGLDIPEPISLKKKFEVAIDELNEKLKELLKKLGLNINMNIYVTYVLFFIFFIFIVYLESKILSKCYKICSFSKSDDKDDDKNKDSNKKDIKEGNTKTKSKKE